MKYDELKKLEGVSKMNKVLFDRDRDFRYSIIFDNNKLKYMVSLENNMAKDVVIPNDDNVIKIENFGFFKMSNLQSVKISKNIKAIGNCAFFNCINLKEVEIPENVVFIGEEAFDSCKNLKKVSVLGKVSEINKEVFAFCENLEEVNFSDGVIKIHEDVFWACNKLKKVTITNSVREISPYAFRLANQDLTVEFLGTTKEWENIKGTDKLYINVNTLDGKIDGKERMRIEIEEWLFADIL